jgi:hypothetical protein
MDVFKGAGIGQALEPAHSEEIPHCMISSPLILKRAGPELQLMALRFYKIGLFSIKLTSGDNLQLRIDQSKCVYAFAHRRHSMYA